MAFSYIFEENEPLTLDEYIHFIEDNIDVQDEDSLKESARALHGLSLNKSLFGKMIEESIKKKASSGGLQDLNSYTDATFILGDSPTKTFFVRANIWKEPKEIIGTIDYENRLYSYHEPHDHNFDFVTVGYFGPGYTTRIYEYEHSRVTPRLDEPVDLRFLEETSLPVGKVMMYRKSVDIHTQMPPPSTSISLNLMVPQLPGWHAEQYYFDLEANTLKGFVRGRSAYQVSILSLAGDIGGEDVIDPLISIAQTSPCERTRAAAVDSVLRISPSTASLMLSRCGADPSPLVSDALSGALQPAT